MKYAILDDTRTRGWANFVAGNVALKSDDSDEFSGSATSAALISPSDLSERWMREYHSLRTFESRHQRSHENLIETVPNVKGSASASIASVNSEIRTLLLNLKLGMLKCANGSDVNLREEPADLARDLLRELVANTDETPVLYTSPDGGLIIDFLDQYKRLTLVLDDQFCIFTLTKNGETAQKTIELPNSDFHADTKSHLEAFSE